MKIVVLERNSIGVDIDLKHLESLGEVEEYGNTLAGEVSKRIEQADIVVINKVPMNEVTLHDAKNVKLICLSSTGYDNVDMEYCGKRGIKVANVVDYSTAAVAQHTFALAFYVLEKLNYYDNYVKSGAYEAQDRFSNFDRPYFELEGKTWGIIGMGNIGKRVAAIATAFGCRVIYYSTSGKNIQNEYERVDFDTICAQSDVLSIHCPLNDCTRNLMNRDAFLKMKKSAILVNVARGPVVNDWDLAEALTRGMIAGAGLDVLSKEPIARENPLGKIKNSDNLIITPHMAWASTEARTRLMEEVALNVEAFLRGEDRNILV